MVKTLGRKRVFDHLACLRRITFYKSGLFKGSLNRNVPVMDLGINRVFETGIRQKNGKALQNVCGKSLIPMVQSDTSPYGKPLVRVSVDHEEPHEITGALFFYRIKKVT